MKKSNKRAFALNVVVMYYEQAGAADYREPLHNLLRQLAWLHGLDYAIDVDISVLENLPNDAQLKGDIVYFRSGQNTAITIRQLKVLVNGLFSRSLLTKVKVHYQSPLDHLRYPFPPVFNRTVKYAFVEHHDGTMKELLEL